MVLSQSMESSAGDLPQVGKIKNEFFYEPFLADDRLEHANLFYEVLKSNSHNKCVLLNTGWIGEGKRFRGINLADTMGILDSVLRDGLEDYMIYDGTGLPVTRSIRAIDSILMHPVNLYNHAEFERQQAALNKQRAESIDKFSGPHKKVIAVNTIPLWRMFWSRTMAPSISTT